MADEGTLLKSAEVAELLRVHPKHVYRLLRRGLPAHRVGGEWRFDRALVLSWAGSLQAPRTAASIAVAPLVAANGDLVIELLLAHVNAGDGPMLGFVQADSGQALALLAEERVLAAGCHGDGPPPRIGAGRLARIHLVTREVGLAWRPGRKAPTLRGLARLDLAVRPPTAGVMVHLSDALRGTGARLGPHRVYSSHRDVACAVLRGEKDAGLLTRAWAERTGLEFQALAREPYGLAVLAERLGHPLITRICEVAQSEPLRRALSGVPGYDLTGAGDIRYDPDAPAPRAATIAPARRTRARRRHT